MEKYLVLYNKLSGPAGSQAEGKLPAPAEKLRSILENGGAATELRDIRSVGSYDELFAEIGEDTRLVLCGGDGTINRYVNESGENGLSKDVYYYPAGTGNDFARDIGFDAGGGPVVINKWLKNLPSVTVNGKTSKFINGVGYGIDGYCCEVGDKLKEKSDKPVNYTSIAIKGLLFHFKSKTANVTVDGKEYEFKNVWIAPSMMGRFYGGGMNAAPDQDRLSEDRTLSLVIMHNKSRLKTLMIFPSIFKGEHIKHTGQVSVIKGHDISVTFNEPSPLQIDGETVTGVSGYSVSFR